MKKQWSWMVLVVLFLMTILCVSAEAASLCQPQEIDNGYWVDALQYYLDSMSEFDGYAALADFDLDGKPELLIMNNSLFHLGVGGSFVKYTGSNYISYNDDVVLLGFDDVLYLVFDNGKYTWYIEHEYANQGFFERKISKLTFSTSMKPSTLDWLTLTGSIDSSMENYYIGSREVSEAQYRSAEARWEGMTKLFTLDPYSFPYPDAWNSAFSQNSVLNQPEKGSDSRLKAKPNQESGEMYRVRKSWNDAASQIGAFTVFSNAKTCADENPGYSVFDSRGNLLYTSSNQESREMYRVRKSWNDAASQIGAFIVFSNAKTCADENPGYSVFDSRGNLVYTSKSSGDRTG